MTGTATAAPGVVRPLAWEGVSVKLAAVVAAGAIDLQTGTVKASTCTCPACGDALAVLPTLFEPAAAGETERLIGVLRHYHAMLWATFAATRGPASDEVIARDAVRRLVLRALADELGVKLEWAVRAATLDAYRDDRGTTTWPYPLRHHTDDCDGGDERDEGCACGALALYDWERPNAEDT